MLRNIDIKNGRFVCSWTGPDIHEKQKLFWGFLRRNPDYLKDIDAYRKKAPSKKLMCELAERWHMNSLIDPALEYDTQDLSFVHGLINYSDCPAWIIGEPQEQRQGRTVIVEINLTHSTADILTAVKEIVSQHKPAGVRRHNLLKRIFRRFEDPERYERMLEVADERARGKRPAEIPDIKTVEHKTQEKYDTLRAFDKIQANISKLRS